MSTSYRIQYKIIEPPHTYSGTRIIEQVLDAYMEFIHNTYPKATYVYLELVEEIEDDDTMTATGESIIILP